ncbi:MAG TPA: metal-sensitive transcriptional regulator [Patescibacteria group bacterium]|nr:metal-sensitive transcriptional regulator [Patescibacteria group bacterium]
MTDKQTIAHQLNRIRGQIDGIANMIDEKRDCIDVMQQILAVRSALARLGKEYLSKEAVQCSRSAKNYGKLDMLLKQLFSLE